MIVRRYQGKTAKEALERARHDLGPATVILLTKRLDAEVGGGIEVVAAVDAADADPEVAVPARSASSREERRVSSSKTSRAAPQGTTTLSPRSTASPPSDLTASLSSEAERLRVSRPGSAERTKEPTSSVESSAAFRVRQRGGLGAYASEAGVSVRASGVASRTSVAQFLRDRLAEQEVQEEVSRLLLREFGDTSEGGAEADPRVAQEALHKSLKKHLAIAGGVRAASKPTLIALVGPTGVGKTTTIAKLAAHFHLRERLPVTLLTVDTYRIAAVEQLRTYANILGLPLEIAMTPEGVRQILENHRRQEVLFLDTPGRSPQNQAQIGELRALLQAAQPTETHLLVSSTTRLRDLCEIARGFRGLEPDRLVFTKLDESANYGNILNFAHHVRLPLSYFTTGQTVPDDIEAVSLDRLASLLLRGRRPLYC